MFEKKKHMEGWLNFVSCLIPRLKTFLSYSYFRSSLGLASLKILSHKRLIELYIGFLFEKTSCESRTQNFFQWLQALSCALTKDNFPYKLETFFVALRFLDSLSRCLRRETQLSVFSLLRGFKVQNMRSFNVSNKYRLLLLFCGASLHSTKYYFRWSNEMLFGIFNMHLLIFYCTVWLISAPRSFAFLLFSSTCDTAILAQFTPQDNLRQRCLIFLAVSIQQTHKKTLAALERKEANLWPQKCCNRT